MVLQFLGFTICILLDSSKCLESLERKVTKVQFMLLFVEIGFHPALLFIGRERVCVCLCMPMCRQRERYSVCVCVCVCWLGVFWNVLIGVVSVQRKFMRCYICMGEQT